jgi:hypothetical protein
MNVTSCPQVEVNENVRVSLVDFGLSERYIIGNNDDGTGDTDPV